MKIIFFAPFYIFLSLILSSCLRLNIFIPEPDFTVYASGKTIEIGEIIERKNPARSIPQWLLTFIDGGIEEVEKLETFNDKYVFVAVNQGENVIALNKWADNFTAAYDFTNFAAIRIEERMILTASLYPDDEYGLFFETFIKNAYSAEYQDAEKEETYWIKHSAPETYHFFILLTIKKSSMQSTIRRMMAQTNAAVAPTGSHAIAVNRLRQNFFEGF
ncbi:MAG: hypothetical protein FWD26_03390 [Treponema sp.]|nr:hypothetical protein [Treponema sp.]